jgi:hypothetical protein
VTWRYRKDELKLNWAGALNWTRVNNNVGKEKYTHVGKEKRSRTEKT